MDDCIIQVPTKSSVLNINNIIIYSIAMYGNLLEAKMLFMYVMGIN